MNPHDKIRKLLIFLPRNVIKTDFQYLNGDIEYRTHENSVVYFITDNFTQKSENIGVWTTTTHPPAKPDFLIVSKEQTGNIVIKTQDNVPMYKTVILYDRAGFHNQEPSKDVFSTLSKKLTKNPTKSYEFSTPVRILNLFINIFVIFHPILKFSSTAVHLKTTFERMVWALTVNNIKAKNFFLSVIFDISLGIFCLYCLQSITSTNDFPDLFLWTSEQCVQGLRNLLQWLAGSPAGFKLNKQLNSILARFFIFYTDIWWIFLVLISPGLTTVFRIFIFLGQFGFTLQAAILSDILALVTFHAYCIYAFAARLYSIQLSGLTSLWRLFLGRKWNPLRDKVDSCQYSAEQLFVGTLLFTILLFLLPTALIYYVVFSTMRLFLVIFGGILTRIRTILHAMPIYSAVLWIVGASSISTQTRMEPEPTLSSKGTMVLTARRVPDSFLTTMKNTLPDFAEIAPMEPGKLIHILLTGQLLCPK